jgi:hypothetical protein
MHALKKCLMLLGGVALVATLQAQAPTPDAPLLYTPEQLDELLAPIALYPDPLIALILPAASAPGDIDQAAQYLAANGDPSQISAQPWDPSVQGLTHYPDVLNWMDSNLDWTQAVGLAFTQQPTDVMESIQQLRAEALAAGTLLNSPEQQITMVGSTICIYPTDPNVIYVPQYDPDGIYQTPVVVDDSSIITYGPGYAVGPWLNYECDWDDYGVWIGVWQPGWAYRRDWQTQRGRAVVAGTGFFQPNPRNRTALARNFAQSNRSLPVPRPQSVPGRASAARAARPASRPAVTAQTSRADPRGYPANTPASPRVVVSSTSAKSPTVPPNLQNRPTAVENRPSAAENNPAPVAENRPPAAENRPAPATENRPAPVAENRAPVAENRPAPTENSPAPVVENRPAPVANNRPTPAAENRPTAPVAVTPRPATAAPQGALFGSYNRGTEAVDNSNRGQASRQAAGIAPSAPVSRPAPAAAPAPRAAPVQQAPRAAPEQHAPAPSPAPASPAAGAGTARGR